MSTQDQLAIGDRTMHYGALATFLMAELCSFVFAFDLHSHSIAPLSTLAIGLPVVALVPWLIAKKGIALISGVGADNLTTTARSAVSRQFSAGVVFAYVLFILTLSFSYMLRVRG
jgi:hypothetical protein